MGVDAGPDFICIGPKKTATTWLADHLKFHRDIWLTPVQELSYLGGDFTQHRERGLLRLRWSRWEVTKRIIRNRSLSARADRRFYVAARELADAAAFDLDGYRALFAPAGRRLAGDISPMYASLTAAQLARAMPVLEAARVFTIARDPVERFWSELAMHARKQSYGDIDYRGVEFARRFFEDPERQRQHLMSDMVARWRAAIGDRLRVFLFDDIRRDPIASLQEIVGWIGADYSKRIPLLSPAYNRKARHASLNPSAEARAWVDAAFQEELRACEDLFGEAGRRWRAKHLL